MMDFQLSNYLLNVFALLLVVISLKLVFSKNLLESVIITSFFSVLIGLSYLLMDAPDVAMTEIALGACLSTCVYLSFLARLSEPSKAHTQRTKIIPASVLCLLFIITMIYAGFGISEYGDKAAALQTHLSKYYIEHTMDEIGIKSFVAALLASYRGYDTLGETAVILLAGVSVLLLFSGKKDHV